MKNSRRKIGRGEDDSSMDRLSNLPESVIHHILSFLETNSAVQTSVLSRRWRSTWKHLSVLDFSDSLCRYRNNQRRFKTYVEKVLSLRYHQLNLSKVTFCDRFVKLNKKPENSLFARVSRYALSHGAQQLGILLHSRKHPSQNPSADLLGFDSDNCSGLKALGLQSFTFGNRFRWSEFTALENLELCWCTFFAGQEEVINIVDPFSNLPCLKHLVLNLFHIPENPDTKFRISGLQLRSLSLTTGECHKMEIHAPKLKRFYLEYVNYLVDFTELTVPSLDHAHIRVHSLTGYDYPKGDWNGHIKQHIIPLFHGLNNVTSFVLGYGTDQMLRDISDYLENQPSPFKRLKFLIADSRSFSNDDVTSAALNYFLKGSSHTKPVVELL
ncbi:Putative F-box/FBD/LRR-repeat protein At4g03220 [Linum grandiflorum]